MNTHSSPDSSDDMSSPSRPSRHSPASSSSPTATPCTPTLSSLRPRRRGSRTLVACEACKKRKTKCSGRSSPCEACRKLDTFCHFNSRLDARRKTAYKPVALHERREFIFSGLLKVLKHNDFKDINHLVDMIRSDASPHEIASCLSQNLYQLQDRGLISSLEVDEMDLVSLGLQGLFSHRGQRATFNSKDQTTYNNTTARNRATNCSETSSNHPDSNANNDSTSVNQDFHSFIKDAGLAKPVMTEASSSLYFEDSYATTTSGYKRTTSTGGEFDGSVANGPFGVQGKGSRGSGYSPSTLECSISRESEFQSIWRFKSQYTPSMSSPGFERSQNLQSSTYNTASPGERMYTAYSANGHQVVDERMAKEQMEGYSSIDSTPISAGWAPPVDWYTPQWAYRTENPPSRQQAFGQEANNLGLNAVPYPVFDRAIFTDHTFSQ